MKQLLDIITSFTIEQLPFEPVFGVPMIIYWIISFMFCTILIQAKLMTKKTRIGFYFITIFFGGLLLGAKANFSKPIQQTMIALGSHHNLEYLLPAILILILLLGSSFMVGRMLCGYACPVGALQELLSLINFKSNIKDHRKNQYHITTTSKNANVVRWSFLVILLVLASIWSIIILPFISPFTGFTFINTLFDFALILPFMSLFIIAITSIFVYRPWCRFLCPFGATSSLFSRFTMNKYIRTEACTECGLCEEICPTQEAAVDSKKSECYYCNRCIDVCPVDAIEYTLE